LAKAGSAIFWSAIVWLLLAGLLALEFWPALPKTAVGWVAFIAFGPPLYVLVEVAAERLWFARADRTASSRQSTGPRVLISTILGAGIVAIGLLASHHSW
jgi:hypothetical protein